MSKEIKLKGLVIKKIDYGEADRVLKVLTQEYGKIDVIVKGIRKSTKRDIIATDVLVLTEFVLNYTKNRIIAKNFITINPFMKIRMSLYKLNIGYYLLSILNAIDIEDSINEKFFKLTLKSLEYINKEENKNDIMLLLVYYCYRLIKFEGLKYKIEEGNIFDIERGVIGDQKGITSIPLNQSERKYLILLNAVDIKGINELKSNENNHYNVLKILEKYINYHLTTNLDVTRLIGRNYLDEFN